MLMYEMVGCASDNNRTYESIYGTYNREDGFKLNDYGKSLNSDALLNVMANGNVWQLKKEEPKPVEMTLEDIEEALGYKVKIVKDDKKDDKETAHSLWDYFLLSL